MRLAWLTDIHLDFLGARETAAVVANLGLAKYDGLLITGDISTAARIEGDLRQLNGLVRRPIYFVLGNHDFYGAGIAEVRARVSGICSRTDLLRYLTMSDGERLTSDTAVVGHDGWSDGRYGDYQGSDVMLNDYVQIRDLTGLSRSERLSKLHSLGDEAASHLRRVLHKFAVEFRTMIVLTHPPPFREACWHEGNISSDDYLPHFSCKATGDALLAAAKEFPRTRFTVLCGHTHSPGIASILPNLTVKTGAAEYGSPRVHEVLEI